MQIQGMSLVRPIRMKGIFYKLCLLLRSTFIDLCSGPYILICAVLFYWWILWISKKNHPRKSGTFISEGSTGSQLGEKEICSLVSINALEEGGALIVFASGCDGVEKVRGRWLHGCQLVKGEEEKKSNGAKVAR